MSGLLGEPKYMHKTRLSLLILSTLLTVSLPVYANNLPVAGTNQNSSTKSTLIAQAAPIDLIGVGATLINSLINPPQRSAEINADAEVKKAKIAADAEIIKEKLRIEASKDRVAPVLNQWGVARVACAPGLVFINGITTDTVCIQPNPAMTAGHYTYDSANQKLIRTSSAVNNTDIQTIQNTQTVRMSNPSRDRGF